DTHPSATALVSRKNRQVIYVTRTNDDSIGLIKLNHNGKARDDDNTDGDQGDEGPNPKGVKKFDLSPFKVRGAMPPVHGAYPNAIAVSPDSSRIYVAEAGINSVAVLDTTEPTSPKLLGRIPTGWYPSALALSPDGNTLYVINAKGIGEDSSPASGPYPPSSSSSKSPIDSNFIFGSAEKVDLTKQRL